MLAFDGNTAPYLLYAYTRIQSVLKKALENGIKINKHIDLIAPAEHKLGLHLAKFADMLLAASKANYPHYVALYLYNLAGLFMQFYESCPILKDEDQIIQQNRLALANLTANVLKTGLEELLGITVTDRM
jgi:arginyl-tRNA synthetase